MLFFFYPAELWFSLVVTFVHGWLYVAGALCEKFYDCTIAVGFCMGAWVTLLLIWIFVHSRKSRSEYSHQ